MANQLVAIAFLGEFAAAQVVEELKPLVDKKVLVVEDAALATRGSSDESGVGAIYTDEQMGYAHQPLEGPRDVHIKQMHSLVKKDAAVGAGLGLVAGLLVGGPVGLAALGGTAVGAVVGSMRDKGIDDKFIKDVANGLRPDSSAIFILGYVNDEEQLMEVLKPHHGRVLKTTLSEEDEARLRDVLK